MARKGLRNAALLGGAALLAAKMLGGKSKGKDSVETAKEYQTYSAMPGGEEVLDETGTRSGFRRNPETGDLYRDVVGDRRTRMQEAADTNKIRAAMGMRSLDQESADDEKIFRATGVRPALAMKKGGKVKKMAMGGSASKRADGIAQRGKTRGKMV